jgi:glycosyltransferase involved in cell wall biosynthesis
VLAGHEADCEVLLVDNNRTAGSVSAQPGLAALLADPRVRVIPAAAARTAGAARNAGLHAAEGEWVTFLDDDDEYTPLKIVRQLARASATGAPFVLCGYEVRLGARRRRIQTAATGFAGDGLLLDAVWGTPFLLHRRDPGHFFDEGLGAAEDLDYALRYLARHGLVAVPNVPEPLVRVHLQSVGRTNTRHEDHWHACRRVAFRQRARFPRLTRRRFLLRARLQRHKGGGGSWWRLLGAGCALLRLGGMGEMRRVANAWLLRTNWFGRWLVS